MAAWKPWFAEHGARLLLFARQQSSCQADAEDVLQNAFLKLWKGRLDRTPPPLAHWFRSIRQCAIDFQRSQSRRRRREEITAAEVPDTAWFERGLEESERQEILAHLVAALPRRQQEVLILKIWGGLTLEEAATVLSIPPATAASRYRYALTTLRRQTPDLFFP